MTLLGSDFAAEDLLPRHDTYIYDPKAELAAPKDRSKAWLRVALGGVGLLAIVAGVVSFAAQYQMIHTVKHSEIIAAMEAGIPDVSAMVFGALGIALALAGKRPLRARILNLAAIATSTTMNYLAAQPGWRDIAIWILPPLFYAVTSDTLIVYIRSSVLARQRALNPELDVRDSSVIDIIGGLLLWMLRFLLDPGGTFGGFRGWVLDEVRVAPGRTVTRPALTGGGGKDEEQRDERTPDDETDDVPPPPLPPVRAGTKSAAFLAAVEANYGDPGAIPDHRLAVIDPSRVAEIAAELAPKAELHAGTARRLLKDRVLASRALKDYATRNGA